MVCEECGTPFTSRIGKSVTCSMVCYQARYRRVNREKRAESKRLTYLKTRVATSARVKAFREANGDRLRAYDRERRPPQVREPRACEVCGTDYLPWLEAQRYCSQRCGQRGRFTPKHPPIKPCELCGVLFTAPNGKRYCSDECIRIVRIRGVREWERRHPAKKLAIGRASGHRRRSRERSLPSERYDVLDIYERDGWICQLCFKPVDRTLSGNDPDGPQIDHIIPYSHPDCPGNLISNVQLAHKRCNSSKQGKYQ